MSAYIEKSGLKVDSQVVEFIETQALPGTGVTADDFWAGMSDLINGFGDENRALLTKRAEIQGQIDAWYKETGDAALDPAAQEAFLREIGYLVPEGEDFAIETANTDPEIAKVAGAQLVVPVMNARYALNAANARWGSLYDALYGTDALGDLPAGKGYDAERGGRVIAWGKAFLDDAVPLASGSWADVTAIKAGADLTPALKDGAAYAGYIGAADAPTAIVMKNNGLHIILDIDASTPVGGADPAGISDIRMESAMSAIMDCEDSVAAVDAEDKVLAWGNWLGLMRGDLTEEIKKGDKTFTRALNPDLEITTPAGATEVLKGRALLLVRNVGHLMTNPAVLDAEGREAGEGFLDAMITVLGSMHDLAREGGNSVYGSVYVVKPKMHGPEEVAFTDRIFTHVEKVLGLP
ncbi:MAG: malate synthase G, partial [Halocynthiibacter sp.]